MKTKRAVRIAHTLSVLFVVTLLFGLTTWILFQIQPAIFPPWFHTNYPTIAIVIGGVGALVLFLAEVTDKLILPGIERSERRSDTGINALRDKSPIRRVVPETLQARLGKGGQIQWVSRGGASPALLRAAGRVAIVGRAKSGKTREAIELMRMALDDGTISAVYEPTSALDLIDMDYLAQEIRACIDERERVLFFVDELGLRLEPDRLGRLSTCIQTISKTRPDAYFLLAIQHEQSTSISQAWLHDHGFRQLVILDLDVSQRRAIAHSAASVFGIQISEQAVEVLATETDGRPYEIVFALQNATNHAQAADHVVDADHAKRLVQAGQHDIWQEQRRLISESVPLAAALLKAIATFVSAGVTPRSSSIRRYVHFLSKEHRKRGDFWKQLDVAAEKWAKYDIVAVQGLYTIPEPLVVPLLIDVDQARSDLGGFLLHYDPGVSVRIVEGITRPLNYVIGVNWLKFFRSMRIQRFLPLYRRFWRRFRKWNLRQRLFLSMPEIVFAWPTDRNLLRVELGSPVIQTANLSSARLVEQGRQANQQGRNDDAKQILARALALNPRNADAHAWLAITLRELGQFEDAITEINQALELDAKNTWLLVTKGTTLELQGHPSEGLAFLNKAVELNRYDGWIYAHRAGTHRALEDYEAALADLGEARRLKLDDEWVIREQVLTLKLLERYDDCLMLLEQAAKAGHISFLNAQLNKGITLCEMGRYDEALATFDRGIEFAPKADWVYVYKGIALREMGQNEAALEWIDKGLEIDPKDSLSHRQRAFTLRAMERHEEALSAFETAATLEPKAAWPIGERGATLRTMKRYDEALEAFDKAAALEPKAAWPLGERGATLRTMKRYDEALEAFDKAAALEPKADRVYVHKGITLRRAGQNEAALEWIDKALEIDPKDSWSHQQRAFTLRAMERHEEALSAFETAATLEPKAAWPLAHRGITLREVERYEEALEALDKGIELNPKADWVYVHKGITLRETGQNEAALEWIDKALEIDPKDSWSHREKGITLCQMERYEEALAAFDTAAELEPKDAELLADKGVILRELGRYDEALTCLNSAVELMSEEAWFLYQRGIVHQLISLPANAQDDVLNAIRFEEQALEKSPERLMLQFNIALYYLALSEDVRSEENYRQVLDRQPTRSQIKEAIDDIESFQRSFPQHEHAKVARNLLDRRLADLESTGETLVGETVG